MPQRTSHRNTVRLTDAPTTPNTPAVERLLYSKNDVAFALNISCRSVSYLISRGDIRVRKLGGRTLIPKAEVVRLSEQDIASLTS